MTSEKYTPAPETVTGRLVPMTGVPHFSVLASMTKGTPPEYNYLLKDAPERATIPRLLEVAKERSIPALFCTTKVPSTLRPSIHGSILNHNIQAAMEKYGFEKFGPDVFNYSSTIQIWYYKVLGVPFVTEPFPTTRKRADSYRIYSPNGRGWITPENDTREILDDTLPWCCTVRVVGKDFPLEEKDLIARFLMILGESGTALEGHTKHIKRMGPNTITLFAQTEETVKKQRGG